MCKYEGLTPVKVIMTSSKGTSKSNSGSEDFSFLYNVNTAKPTLVELTYSEEVLLQRVIKDTLFEMNKDPRNISTIIAILMENSDNGEVFRINVNDGDFDVPKQEIYDHYQRSYQSRVMASDICRIRKEYGGYRFTIFTGDLSDLNKKIEEEYWESKRNYLCNGYSC